MYGAIIGDIVGSIYEFNNIKSKKFPFMEPRSFFTDDTVCTIAIAEAALSDRDYVAALRRWGRKYPDAGYGHRFKRWLSNPKMGPYNSFGNGASMRISPVAFLSESPDRVDEQVIAATAITHNHPEGIRGARATAFAIKFAVDGANGAEIRQMITEKFDYDMSRSVSQIRPGYKFTEASQNTVPEALTCALEASNFVDAIRNAVSIGGDSDTVSAIAGGLAEAMFGIPDHILDTTRTKLPEEMKIVMTNLYRSASSNSTRPISV